MDDELKVLGQLSALAGILPEYTDNWGQRHTTSPTTQRALLTAMGIDVSTPEKISAAIAEHESRPWRRVLEPVSVLRDSASGARLVLPDVRAGEQFEWRLILEDGGEHTGLFKPTELPRLASRKIDGIPHTAWKLELPPGIVLGYHRLEFLRQGETVARQTFIVVPATCYQPDAVAGAGRVWGPAVQLYAVRSARNWGIGDFTDLRALLEQWAAQGADILGINPLHALFPHNPEHASPYSPSSRLFFNVLYLDVEAIDDFRECDAARTQRRTPEFQTRLESLRAVDLVDYAGVAELKLPMLEMSYRHFREHHLIPGSARAAAFRAFQAREGERLDRHTLFEALQEHFHDQDPGIWGWPAWPAAYRHPEAVEIREFEARHRERIEFFAYLQWQADLQLAAVGARSSALGLGVGLYLDLAVSVDVGGAETWANQALYAEGVGVGAPPDANFQLGQNWGLLPFVPEHLRESAYGPFISTLRHNMRHAGALRLDHVMGLMRQYWAPAGSSPADGAYVLYPFEDLLGILALESQRNRCLVIGEDLGTVPDAVRTALARSGAFCYRLLTLEKDANGDFIAPAAYPAQALAAVTTHDLPTLAGYWEGRDILQRAQRQMFRSDEAHRTETAVRAQERASLLLALERAGLLPAGATTDPASLPTATPELLRALHTYTAGSPAKLLMVQLEDMLGVLDQVNLPSTTTQYPNWRRKLPQNLETFTTDQRVLALAAALRQARPRTRPVPARRRSVGVPRATYRLQLSGRFTFVQATHVLPYLAQLGVSHVYCSPYLKARAGSPHGYDIVDHNALNPEIGSPDDFDRFVTALAAHGMGQMLDLVPNHMGVGGDDNVWWLDVLENGQASEYAEFFDIDWWPAKPELRGKVLLPFLEDHYGKVLEDGLLRLEFDAARGEISVRYHDHRFPLDPKTYTRFFESRLESLNLREATVVAYRELVSQFDSLPSRQEAMTGARTQRHRDKEILKQRLARLVRETPAIAAFLDDGIRRCNGTPGQPASFDSLHALLEEQAYRLAYWRVAADEINYRRFFDVDALAALRMERPAVFSATHRLVLDLIHQGKVQALRIDHPDGLYDPAGYFQTLRAATAARAGENGSPVYTVAEKILIPPEPLPEDWPIDGTTGYDFANVVTGLFVHPAGETPLTRLYTRVAGDLGRFADLLYDNKKLVMRTLMSGELMVLANYLDRLSEAERRSRDYTLHALRDALMDVIACFPVYRTYVAGTEVTEQDRRFVNYAIAQARRRSPAVDVSVFDFIRSVLLLEDADGSPDALRETLVDFVRKFQQYTSPVMAKGFEDTSFYAYNRFVALNEVGGDPRRFGQSVEDFHRANATRHACWPHSMLCSSTHDTKRSEDVRARLVVLSEIPDEWRGHVQRWVRFNRDKKREIDGEPAPDGNDEYLLYQTLLGAWPIEPMNRAQTEEFQRRIADSMRKAVREAKRHTSWINPNEGYEAALTDFVHALLAEDKRNRFLIDFVPFARKVARFGLFNSLSQTLLKLTAPGVPDIYQGTETWDFSLMDPDNRRPVDYARRAEMLNRLEALDAFSGSALAGRVRLLLENPGDGHAKLHLLRRVLQWRRGHDALFFEGGYEPLAASGEHEAHLCAFQRRLENEAMVVVVGRWFAKLPSAGEALPLGEAAWGADTWVRLPPSDRWREAENILTGERLEAVSRDGGYGFAAAALFARFPVALLRLY